MHSASGAVYVAESLSGLRVAVKKMIIAQQVKKSILINEIISMKACNHANIVNFINCYLNDGILWVAMEYVNGASLTQVIEVCKHDITEPMIALVSFKRIF